MARPLLSAKAEPTELAVSLLWQSHWHQNIAMGSAFAMAEPSGICHGTWPKAEPLPVALPLAEASAIAKPIELSPLSQWLCCLCCVAELCGRACHCGRAGRQSSQPACLPVPMQSHWHQNIAMGFAMAEPIADQVGINQASAMRNENEAQN
jgi:hypothetical protein